MPSVQTRSPGRTASASGCGSRFVERLPSEARQSLITACEEVELTFEDVITRPGDAIKHAYFPLQGYISQIARTHTPGLEIALTGDEGMFGLPIALGMPISQVLAVVQGPGTALRTTAARFRRELASHAALRAQMQKFTYFSLGNIALMSECAKYHTVDQRLARWLLMVGDRCHSASFRMTHVFLAYMLGVRRVGVTVAAKRLQDQAIIRYRRGQVQILDTDRLEAVACDCYQASLDGFDDAYRAPRQAAR